MEDVSGDASAIDGKTDGKVAAQGRALQTKQRFTEAVDDRVGVGVVRGLSRSIGTYRGPNVNLPLLPAIATRNLLAGLSVLRRSSFTRA